MDKKIRLLEKQLKRERTARKQAESILEQKALELYEANRQLQLLNENLEQKALNKTLELETSERRYRQIVESAHDIIYRFNSEGTVTYMNSVVSKILGYKNTEIIGRNFSKFIPQKNRNEVIGFYLETIANRVEQSYYEFQMKHKSGKPIWIGQNVRLYFENGVLTEGTAMARDITRRKSFQLALQRSEERYRSIIENMELGLMEVDLQGVIVKPYPIFCEMVGYTAEELIGKTANEILLPEEFKPVLDKQNKDRKSGKPGVYEVQIKRKDGKRIWVLISGAPIRDIDGSTVSTMGIHYDITYQKNLQKDLELAKQTAEAAQEAEKQFLTNMSHEIRTPLNAIIGMSHLLYDTNPTEEQKEYLSVLKSSSNLLHQLISDILDLSKVHAGKLEVQLKEFDLKGIIKSLEKNFQLKLEGRPIEVRSFTGEGMDNLMIGDDLLLNQILLNLLGNAAKFTTEGHIHLYLNLINVKGKQKTFEFRVVDTGIGIPADRIDIIFQSFRQVDGNIRRKFGGTGLGLTITKQLIDLQGGKISVESTVGEGTTFIVQLTFEDSGIKIQSKRPTIRLGQAKEEHKKKILVVEDNYMNRKYISSLLKKWGYEYKMAHNGKEGVDIAKKELFDVIFMDIQMPVLDGYQATIDIRNNSNLNQNTPIIALTASALISQKNKALKLGMTDYISKPFKPNTLLEKLQNIDSIHISEEGNAYEFHTDLDQTYLDEIYDGDLEYAIDMFETFLTVTSKEVSELQQQIKASDWEKVIALAHKLKPTFAMVGMTATTEKMKILEHCARQHPSVEELQRHYEKIQLDLTKFLPILQEELGKMQTYL